MEDVDAHVVDIGCSIPTKRVKQSIDVTSYYAFTMASPPKKVVDLQMPPFLVFFFRLHTSLMCLTT